MKKIKFLATLLAAGALVACNETIEPQGSGENTPTTGEGYVKVAINMPTTSGDMTKVDDSGIFDDGLESEYAVNNCIIAFFKGADESAATFAKAYNVNLNQGGSGNQQVTSRHLCITQAPFAEGGSTIYALAILNNNGKFTVNNAGQLLLNRSEVFTTDNKTISALTTAISNATVSEYANNNGGFLMTNSPLSNLAGNAPVFTTIKAQTLVPVQVYETENEAISNDAANIYVERVVAKVTLKGFKYSATGTTVGTEVYHYTKKVDDPSSAFNNNLVGFEGWTLNVTNKSFKPVRDVSQLATWMTDDFGEKERFLGSSAVDNNGLYRIYWAIDNNYDNYTDAFNIYTTEGTAPTWTLDMEHEENGNAVSVPLYCFENTMDYDQQNRNQTTSVIIKAKYWLTDSNNDTPLNTSFFMYGDIAKTYTETDFLSEVRTAANNILADSDDFTAEEPIINTAAPGGNYDGTDGRTMKDLFKKDANTELTDAQVNAIWNAIGTIKYYKNGDSYYYTTLIKHFDHTNEVPLANGADYDETHLGRYGVVRNNWYEINVTSISGPGEPEIDEPDGPDDNTEGYIRAEINVLSWAKRSQDVNL